MACLTTDFEVIGVRGGMKFYRGFASAARAYVEADHHRADDYYLTEGAGIATRYVVQVDQSAVTTMRHAGDLDGDSYERWVAGYDAESGRAKGHLRNDANALRFVEVTVNGPKTWSLAAALHPEVSAVLDAAQDRAAEQIISWVAAHATTRVGPRGRQVQIPVERIEAACIRHYTSRAGDPHRHIHLQINARVFCHGTWRGLHSVGMRDFLEAINGIGHAAVATDPGFRQALGEAGLTLDQISGEVAELTPYSARFSARAAQIRRNVDRFEVEWRAEHPGEKPGPRLRQAWDRRAWSHARPDKAIPVDGAAMVDAWGDELHRLGYRDPRRSLPSPMPPRIGELDRDEAVRLILTRLEAKRSAWNAADIRGQVEQWIAQTGLIADAALRIELAEDLTARTVVTCTRLLARRDVPEHVRALTSTRVIEVEDQIGRLLRLLADQNLSDDPTGPFTPSGLDAGQRAAPAALAGTKHLLVIEGAAGAGKTTTLAAATIALAAEGRHMVVVTPTLKAAEVASTEVGAPAFSAAWLAYQWGWRWDDEGRWNRALTQAIDARASLTHGDLLVVDEAGMLDQDTARALLEIAHERGARVAFMGDRHQLPAVGRGGVLDLAAQHAGPDATISLDVVHRFSDPAYAELSVAMRRGEPVFDDLWERGQIRLHHSDPERLHHLAQDAAEAILAGRSRQALMATSRDQVAELNRAIRDQLVARNAADDTHVVVNDAGERLGVGDRVATRRNDTRLGIANRQTWTITAVATDAVSLTNERGQVRDVPNWYAQSWVELAYATTVYGAQGETTAVGHMVIDDSTSAASAYVGMTRGRHNNTAHIVADSPEQARKIWEQALSRDRADLGVAHARVQALDDIDRYGPLEPTYAPADTAAQRDELTRRREREARHARHPEPTRRPSRSGPGIG